MKDYFNILIVCGHFYPEQNPRSFRSTELAKEFAKQGHNVTVITPEVKEAHSSFQEEHNVTIKDLGKVPRKFKIPKSGIGRLPIRILNRFLYLLFEYPDVFYFLKVRKALKNCIKFDLLISVAVPHPIHWGVASIWTKNKVADTWVADCGDPFMYNKHDSFQKLPYFHFLENNFLKKADYVSIPFKEMSHLFNSKYINKFRVIPQGFQLDNIVLAEYNKNRIPTFIYSGTVMPHSRDPYSLIKFLESQNINYNFIIYTNQKHLFDQFSDLLEERIFLKDYINRISLIYELSKADFLININTESNDGLINAVPSKLIDYKLSGRPILSYEQNKLPKKIVLEFINADYSNQYKHIDLANYNISNVASKFIGLLRKNIE